MPPLNNLKTPVLLACLGAVATLSTKPGRKRLTMCPHDLVVVRRILLMRTQLNLLVLNRVSALGCDTARMAVNMHP